jgi:hypothetical protein
LPEIIKIPEHTLKSPTMPVMEYIRETDKLYDYVWNKPSRVPKAGA